MITFCLPSSRLLSSPRESSISLLITDFILRELLTPKLMVKKAPKRQNKGPPLTPATPRGPTSNATETLTQDGQPAISAQDSQLPISPSATPPASPSSPSTDLPSQMTQSSAIDQTPLLEPTVSADDIISKDIVAIADMFATMKKAMVIMTSAFDRFEIQTEKFASLGLDIKAAEQVCPDSYCDHNTLRLIPTSLSS